jgi:hypothetical protein
VASLYSLKKGVQWLRSESEQGSFKRELLSENLERVKRVLRDLRKQARVPPHQTAQAPSPEA